MERVFVAMAILCMGGSTSADSAKRVTVTGVAPVVADDVATARAAAIQQGQRLAIEQVIGALIQSEFTAQQQEILTRGAKEGEFSSSVRDEVVTQSAGFVRSQRILAEKRVGDTYQVTLQVEVSATSLHEELASLEELMAAVGYPKTMLLAGERYMDRAGKESWTRSQSAVRIIEEALLARNVSLVAAQKPTSGTGQLAALLQSPTQIAEAAEASGADIAIVAVTEARFGSHNDFGNNLYYVSATVSVQAVRAATGRVLASFNRKGRGIGISEADARENAVTRAAPKIIEALLKSLARAWQAELRRGALEIRSQHRTAVVRVNKKRFETKLVEPGGQLSFSARGPATLALSLHLLGRERQRGLEEATIELARDSRYQVRWQVQAKAVRRSEVSGTSFTATTRAMGHLEIPAGSHEYVLRVNDPELGLAMAIEPVAAVVAKKRLPEETRAAAPIAWALPPGASARELPAAAPQGAAAAEPQRAPAAEPRRTAVESPARPVGREQAMVPTSPAALPKVEMSDSDGTIGGATRVLADAVGKSFASNRRASLFHRVAIPYFEEVGPAVAEHRLGRLVAELFAVELAARPPFVVIERERLGQVMAEHRLVGLGMVDQQDAAEFGRILGAQSVISGTVSEAGPQFIVTVRQVEVETGQVLVTGSVGIQRDGLIALSSELVVKRTVAGAAFRSALIPGWGQIYNGDSAKGWVLAGAGAGAAATAITFTVLRLLKGNEYDSAEEGVVSPVELRDLREEGDGHASRASVAWWAYGAIWALAIIDAVVNGEEYETVQSDAFASSGSARL